MSADPLGLLLRSFKLPTMAQRYPETLASAQAQGWDCRRFLLDLCEAEAADRKERRRERLLKESGLPTGKTLGTLDEEQLPTQNPPTMAEPFGRRLRGAGRKRAGLRLARPR